MMLNVNYRRMFLSWMFLSWMLLSWTFLSMIFVFSVGIGTAISSDANTVVEGTLAGLYADVAALNLGRNGYVLAHPLTPSQRRIAAEHKMESTAKGTYRFEDPAQGGCVIVAESTTHRVLLVMESVEHATRKTAQVQVGAFFMEFGEPTISAHDRIVYWAYGKEGKYSTQAFEESKKRQQPLPIIATIKLQSEMKIVMSEGDQNRSTDSESVTGHLYSTVTSEAILRHFVKESV